MSHPKLNPVSYAIVKDRFNGLAVKEGIEINKYLNPDKCRIMEMEEFFDFANLPNHQLSILEIGSGRGNYSIPLLQLGHKMTCVDISETSLNILKTTASMLGLDKNLEEIYCGDFLNWDSKCKKYDLILGTDILHHILGGLDSLHRIFQKISTGLHQSGKIIFKEPNPLFPWRIYFF